MDRNYYFLTYRSNACVEPTSPEIGAILASSRRNNRRAGLTGFLSLDSGIFVQYLEGPKPEVKALLEVLLTDTRHTGLVVTSHGWQRERLFSDWQMQLVLTPAQDVRAPRPIRDAAHAVPEHSLERHGIFMERARRRIPIIANSPGAPAMDRGG